MRPARSIRTRLLIGILLSLALILGVAAWASYEVTQHESEEIFGARLATSARVLEALVAKQLERATIAQPIVIALPRELELGTGDAGSPLGHPYETKIAFQVWRSDGTLLARSASAPLQPFSPNAAGFSRQALEHELWQVFVLRSGNTWIQVAEKNEVRDELMHDLGIAVMTPLIVGAAILLIVANLLVIYGLAPLRELAASIEKREPNALGQVETKRIPRELAPVVKALNDLLARMRRAFERERRFTDAAAHELRTPLAALKIHADNVVRAHTDAERSQSMDKLRKGLDRATKLAEQMLAYSRAQDAADHEQRIVLRLFDIVTEAITSSEPMRRARSQLLKLESDIDANEAAILAEPMMIERLLLNLLDNASRYGPSGAEIGVRLSVQAGTLALSVANRGKPIPAELRERVFEPYYRLPGSGSEGSGLGLAIVKEIAEQHGATIELATMGDGEGTLITLRFPLEAKQDGSS